MSDAAPLRPDLLNPTQEKALLELRGSGEERPEFSRTFADDLRSDMEESLRDVEGTTVVSKRKLQMVHQCEGRYAADDLDNFEWAPRIARGVIVHKAIELSVGGHKQVTPTTLIDHAVARIMQAKEHESLAEWLRKADDAELAELRSLSTDLVIKFQEMFPPLQPSWSPTAESSTASWLFGGRIRFTGKIDLRLGRSSGMTASALILDFKTGSPSFSDLEDLRFYALTETLRCGVPPFRWANLYLDAGRWQAESVTEATLRSAARRAVDGARKIVELDAGRTATLTPGNACRFCPARPTCPAAAAAAAQAEALEAEEDLVF